MARKNTRRLAMLCALTALAIILSILESFLPPPLPMPGVKWGFANIVTLVAVALWGLGEALSIAVLRSFLVSLLLGSLLAPSFFMSMAGAILAALVMGLAKRFFPKLSLIGVSILGAVFHNIGQLFAASFIVSQTMVFYYLPVLLLTAIPTGLITGYLGRIVARNIAPLK